MKTSQLTADDVVVAVRRDVFKDASHAWLTEVRNGTGHARSPRSADAVVVSCWPSRGLWIAGFEIKVSRGDWLSELRNPAKAEAVAAYCDFWWLATPAGLVRAEELPAGWGLIEVDKKASIVKAAPRHEPKPLDLLFVASCLRNAAEGRRRARDSGREEARAEMAASTSAQAVAELRAQLVQSQVACDQARRKADVAQHDLASLEARIGAVEAGLGLRGGDLLAPQSRWGDVDKRTYAAALALSKLDAERVAQLFDAAASALRRADAATRDGGP